MKVRIFTALISSVMLSCAHHEIAMSLADKAEEQPRMIEIEETIQAPIDAAWKAWTTNDGAKEFFAPEANIVAKKNGPYELYFDLEKPSGLRGSEGCTIVEFDTSRKLAFTWNFPPHLSIRDEHTVVTVVFEAVDNKQTRVRLQQTGWKEGPEWTEGFGYFQRAWKIVLKRLQHRFKEGPIDWSHPFTPTDLG